MIRETLSTALIIDDTYGVFRKLLLNETSIGTDFGFWRLLGFVHLVSASGIHLYALQNYIDFLLQKLTDIFAPQSRLVFWRRVSVFISYLVILYAWYLSQFRFGLMRPFIIVFLRNASLHLGFRWRFWSPLFLSLILDLAVSSIRHLLGVPNAFFSGRAHYALAVGGGLAAIELIRNRETTGRNREFSKSHWKSHLHFHFALSVGSWLPTAAYDAFFANMISWATPIISLVSIPIFTSIVYPLLLVQSVFSPEIIWDATHHILNWTNWVLKLLAEWTMTTKMLWGVNSWVFLLVLALIFLFGRYWFTTIKKKVLLFLIVIILRFSIDIYLCWSVSATANQVKSVEQWNVGQGDSAMIRTKSAIGFIDTGTRGSFKSSRLIERWLERKVFYIDWIALTHLDQDHAGALERWMKLIPVEKIYLNEVHLISDKGVKLRNKTSHFGVHIDSKNFPGVWLQCNSTQCQHAKNGNMSGYFFEIENRGGWYLNLGDASEEDEILMIDQLEKSISTPLSEFPGERVFKVSHHGSKFSTSQTLLEKLNPTQVWISVGSRNKFGHPTHRVLRLLSNFDVPIRRTDRDGDLVVQDMKLNE